MFGRGSAPSSTKQQHAYSTLMCVEGGSAYCTGVQSPAHTKQTTTFFCKLGQILAYLLGRPALFYGHRPARHTSQTVLLSTTQRILVGSLRATKTQVNNFKMLRRTASNSRNCFWPVGPPLVPPTAWTSGAQNGATHCQCLEAA